MTRREIVCTVAAAASAAALSLAAAAAAQDAPPKQGGSTTCRAPDPVRPAPPGLRLVARAETETVQPGAPVLVKLSLVNGSKDEELRVVRPGDGSDAGWREPWMWWEAAYVNDLGEETPAEKLAMLRCGNFDPTWTDDIETLKPGASIDVTEGPTPISSKFEFQRAGKVRIRAWYSWGAGAHLSGPGTTDEMRKDLGAMKDTPAFELASNPVIVTVVRPIDVVLRVKRAPRVGRVERPEQFLEVTARSADGNPFVLAPDGWTLTWECRFSDTTADGWEEEWSAPQGEDKRAPTASHVLTDAVPRVRRVSYPWRFGKPGAFRVAARLTENREGGARILSAWTDVAVEK